jgi:hypothetical protein
MAAAAVFAAVTASDPPPKAPFWLAQTAGTTFANVAFEFIAGPAPRVNLRYRLDPTQDANDVTGFRLYLGSNFRASGQPMAIGNTPYDLGNLASASIAAATDGNAGTADVILTPSSNALTYVAVTAYNRFGNESDYANKNATDNTVKAAIIPLSAPTITNVSTTTTQVSFSVTQGVMAAPCTGCSVRTEVWRKNQGQPDTSFTLLTNPPLSSNQTFTDTGRTNGTTYEYAVRSFAQGAATANIDTTAPVTYSALVRQLATTDELLVFTNVAVSGIGNTGGPTSVTLQPNDQVTIDSPSGNVNFNTAESGTTCDPANYTVGPVGRTRQSMPQGQCWDVDLNICLINSNDPITGANHAGLFRPAVAGGGGATFIGNGSDSFTYTGSSNTALRLGVNDTICSQSPNSGEFRVRVTIIRPRS